MEEIYIVTRYFIPIEGSDSRSQERFDNLVAARKRWHTLVASDLDKPTILWELIQIVRGFDGVCLASEIINNRVSEEA